MARNIMHQMDLSAEQNQLAIRLFNEGKDPAFPVENILLQLRQEVRNRRNLLRMFVEIQLAAAYADGVLDPGEQALLLQICDDLGISRFEYQRLEAMVRAERFGNGRTGFRAPTGKTGLDDAYAILNVSTDASDHEIKKSYRRLLSQHHPDKLVSKGLPEEMMKIAAQKTHEIRKAYERIREARGF
jgi:DnaJ like chaperone protein